MRLFPRERMSRLQPHKKKFLDISNPEAILETTLRNYSCLTTGDSIMVAYNSKKYYIDTIETKASNAISIIETNCEVDFAPLDYKEPEKPVPISLGKALMQAEESPAEVEPKFNPFTGSARLLVGRPLSHQPPPVSTTASKDKQSDSSRNGQPSTATSSKAPALRTQGKLVFGSNANRTPQNTKKMGKNRNKKSRNRTSKSFSHLLVRSTLIKGLKERIPDNFPTRTSPCCFHGIYC